jgi:hypothetical protein
MAKKAKSRKKALESGSKKASAKKADSRGKSLASAKGAAEAKAKKGKKAARAAKLQEKSGKAAKATTFDIESFASEAAVQSAVAAVTTVKAPEIPVHRLVSEARGVVFVAKKDVAELTRIHFNLALVPLISSLASGLENLQIRINKARDKGRTTAEIKAEDGARTYRERTLESLEYALREDATAAGRISDIREGEGLDDLLDDVGVVIDFVAEEETAAALVNIGEDPAALAAEGRTHRAGLSKLVYSRRAGNEASSLVPERNRIATALSAAVGKLYAAGRYAFRDDPKKARNYASTYTRVRKAQYRAQKTRAKKEAAKTPKPLEGNEE